MARLTAPTLESVRSDVAHLLRRSGFGATPARVDELADGGYEAAIDTVLRGLTSADPGADALAEPTFDVDTYLRAAGGTAAERKTARVQAKADRQALVSWWVQRMVAADHPVQEKTAFLWHDHFATSLTKVRLPNLMAQQRRTIVAHLGGRFDRMVAALAVDPAMLIWLDGRDSTADAPNENFARELLELFTLGHGGGHHGSQPYTEDDVHEAARALTGWVIGGPPGAPRGALRSERHDDGHKEVLGTSGDLELKDIVRIATQHPACAPHVVSRLWSRLAYPADADDPTVRELAEGFKADLDLGALLRAIFLHPSFRSAQARTGLIRMPIDFVVGTLRALGAPAPDRGLIAAFAGLAQVPFVPPDVAGWPHGEAWLSTSSAQVRIAFAQSVASRVDVGPIEAVRPAERPAVLAHLLSLDGWNDATAAAIGDAPDGQRALVVALVSPEHLVA